MALHTLTGKGVHVEGLIAVRAQRAVMSSAPMAARSPAKARPTPSGCKSSDFGASRHHSISTYRRRHLSAATSFACRAISIIAGEGGIWMTVSYRQLAQSNLRQQKAA